MPPTTPQESARRLGRAVQLTSATTVQVVRHPGYAVLSLVASFAALSVFVLAQNHALFLDLILRGPLPLADRLVILVDLYPFIGPGFTHVVGGLLVVAAVLFGLNITMLAFLVRRQRHASARASTGSTAGLVFGTVGAGCAACGVLILPSLLGLAGATAMLSVLPLEGGEILLIAIVALAAGLYPPAARLHGLDTQSCDIPPGPHQSHA